MNLKQFVPPNYCVNCDVCCRFLDQETQLAPVCSSGRGPGKPEIASTYKLVPHLDRFICENFDPVANRCRDYEVRPLDCRLYPFVVMYSSDYKELLLAADQKCPYVEKSANTRQFRDHVAYLSDLITDIDSRYASRFQDDILIVIKLEQAGRKVFAGAPVLRKLLIGDKPLFDGYAAKAARPFSSYSFTANYIWSDLLEYYWALIEGRLCIFAKSAGGFFMPLPPLGKGFDKKAVSECWSLMDRLNTGKNVSRIEDIDTATAENFSAMGFTVKEKGREYTCLRTDLASLSGDPYKAKRALCNNFAKNNKFEYRAFEKTDIEGCLDLFNGWKGRRTADHTDSYYRALLEDSYFAHKRAMDRYGELDLTGRVITLNGKISAYTFGYALTDELFVILFEVSDLRVKGVAQFIFREFCRELDRFHDINLMDDSGLENLKTAKLSYHPTIIERQFAAYG